MNALKAETLYPSRVISSLFIMNEQLKLFAENVERHMAQQELSRADLAKRAGISPKTFNNLLNGRHAPQLDVLVKIADALKVDLWRLWVPKTIIAVEVGQDVSDLRPEALKAVTRYAKFELDSNKPQ